MTFERKVPQFSVISFHPTFLFFLCALRLSPSSVFIIWHSSFRREWAAESNNARTFFISLLRLVSKISLPFTMPLLPVTPLTLSITWRWTVLLLLWLFRTGVGNGIEIQFAGQAFINQAGSCDHIDAVCWISSLQHFQVLLQAKTQVKVEMTESVINYFPLNGSAPG